MDEELKAYDQANPLNGLRLCQPISCTRAVTSIPEYTRKVGMPSVDKVGGVGRVGKWGLWTRLGSKTTWLKLRG